MLHEHNNIDVFPIEHDNEIYAEDFSPNCFCRNAALQPDHLEEAFVNVPCDDTNFNEDWSLLNNLDFIEDYPKDNMILAVDQCTCDMAKEYESILDEDLNLELNIPLQSCSVNNNDNDIY